MQARQLARRKRKELGQEPPRGYVLSDAFRLWCNLKRGRITSYMDECPNISGRPGYEEEALGQSFSGPFRQVAHYTVGPFDGLDNQNHKGVYFDASFVSSIYGSSSLVQPPAVAALALIKI